MNNTPKPSDSKQANYEKNKEKMRVLSKERRRQATLVKGHKKKMIRQNISELLSNGEQADLFLIILDEVDFTPNQLLHIEGLYDRYYEEMYGVNE